jgi:hypothetical protein
MRKPFMGAIVSLAVLACVAQVAQSQSKGNRPLNPWKYYPRNTAVGDGGPAPVHDLSGTWVGPGSSPAVPRPTRGDKPLLTPLGEKILSERKPIGKYGPAGTNDPEAKYCDPLGFPRNILTEGRALSIATIGSNRIAILYQFNDNWREIWLDGRALPTDVGGEKASSLDPRYMGFSTGHWVDDHTLVVDTTGLDSRTWLNGQGLPHSVDAHIEERYTRVDHNTITLTVTVTDPKMYQKPFSLGTFTYRWVPTQEINEWLCVPSEQMQYLQQQGIPAGSFPNAPPVRY